MSADAPVVREVDTYAFGRSWVLDEPMQRASHALADGGRVWLVDAVDVPEQIEAALGLGEPAGVIQLLDRHGRDNAALAARLGVPHLRVPDVVPDSPFDVVRVLDIRGWHERALWWPQRRALVVAEVVGTGPFYRLSAAPAGIHPFLRLRPPRALRGYEPEHLLVGHGAGVHGPEAAAALREAYARSLRDLPGLVKLPFRARG